MTRRSSTLLALAAVLLLGCNREAPAPQQDAAEAPVAPAAAAAVAPSTEVMVRTVESVMVTRPQDAPTSVVIQVSGTVSSTGWSDPKLVPVDGGDPSSRSFNFVATSPAAAAEDVTEAVEASLQLDTLPPEVKTIRIVSATNAVSAFLP